MNIRSLLRSTALSTRNPNQRILDAFFGNDDSLKSAFGDGATPIPLAALAKQAANENQSAQGPVAVVPEGKTPVFQQAFRAYLAAHPKAEENIRQQLQELRDESKQKKGFLSKVFGIFSHKNPAEKIAQEVAAAKGNPVEALLGDAAAFDAHCKKNRITFDEQQQKLVKRERADMRFLLAAAGGAALGALGVNLGDVPVLQHAPTAFFSVALPWLAAPFIGLNVYKTFSETSIAKAMPTLGRFSAITGLGFATSYAAVKFMEHVTPLVNPDTIRSMSEGAGSGIPNPLMYMLPIMGGCAAAALVRKNAHDSLSAEFNPLAEPSGWRGALAKAYNKFNDHVVHPLMRHPAPYILRAAGVLDKAADGINKAFPAVVKTLGVPAVATVLSSTTAKGGFSAFGNYAGYYATVGTALAMGAGVMYAMYRLSGVRNKDMGPVAHVMKDAFLISSSSAVLPQEVKALKKIGVTDETTGAVTPLAGAFNMFGTALYMGTTAMYGSLMFGQALTPQRVLEIGLATFAIAMGAPGVAASNITLLAPVMAHTGLTPPQIDKIYSMVLPADRPLDMAQTALNAAGDMAPAVHIDRKVLKEKYAKEDAANADKPGLLRRLLGPKV